MKKFEKNLLEFINDKSLFLGFIFVTFFALIMRFCMFPYESHDYTMFLSGWFDYLKNNGGLLALATYQGNYNAPYMTIMALLTYLPFNSLHLIKFVSIIFDFGLALSSAALVKYLVPKNKNLYYFITYSVMLFIPEIVLNSAVWGQCDAGYTMFIVLALLYLFKEDYLKSFIFLGVSFALKLQFIFILPLFIIIYFTKKKFSIWHFFIIPLVNIILCLPAIIIGKPIKDLLLVYFLQTAEYKEYINLNFINLYGLVGNNGNILHAFGIFTTLLICLITLIYLMYKKVNLTNKMMLNLGLWFVVIVTFFLPCMHERYLYLGCVLAVIYFITYKENFILMISILLCSILTYFSYLFGYPFNSRETVIIAYTIILALYTKKTYESL